MDISTAKVYQVSYVADEDLHNTKVSKYVTQKVRGWHMRLDRRLLQFTLPGPPFPSTMVQPLGIVGVYGHITLDYVTEVSTSLELTSNVERGMLLLFLQSIGCFLRGLMLEGGSFGH